MKKIVFVINSLSMGGEQKVTTVLANELSEKNKVTIINFSGNEKPYFKTEVPLVNFKQENKINFIFRKGAARLIGGILKREVSPFFMNQKHIDELINYINQNHPDVLILVAELPYYTKILKKIFPWLKIIIWIHNPLQLYYEHIFRYSRELFLKSLIDADKVIVLTHQDVAYGKEELGINVHCIYNPITLENKNSHEIQLQKDSKKIAMAGRYSIKQKGLDYLPKIIESLSEDWSINLAGTGNKNEINQVKKIFHNVSEKHFRRLGALDNDGMIDLFSTSEFYLMTSRYEGLPLVLIEAMSFGLPIVSFDNLGTREILENGKYGILVEQGDIKKLNQEIKYLIQDKEKREYYSKQSLARVREFSKEKIIIDWEKCIND